MVSYNKRVVTIQRGKDEFVKSSVTCQTNFTYNYYPANFSRYTVTYCTQEVNHETGNFER